MHQHHTHTGQIVAREGGARANPGRRKNGNAEHLSEGVGGECGGRRGRSSTKRSRLIMEHNQSQSCIGRPQSVSTFLAVSDNESGGKSGRQHGARGTAESSAQALQGYEQAAYVDGFGIVPYPSCNGT